MASERRDGVVGALIALADLREAMKTVKLPSPDYALGYEKTAYDACEQLIEHTEWNLRRVGVFLGEILVTEERWGG